MDVHGSLLHSLPVHGRTRLSSEVDCCHQCPVRSNLRLPLVALALHLPVLKTGRSKV